MNTIAAQATPEIAFIKKIASKFLLLRVSDLYPAGG
jgi:hypothetical protein